LQVSRDADGGGELAQLRRERDELQRLLDKFERHMAEVMFAYLFTYYILLCFKNH